MNYTPEFLGLNWKHFNKACYALGTFCFVLTAAMAVHFAWPGQSETSNWISPQNRMRECSSINDVPAAFVSGSWEFSHVPVSFSTELVTQKQSRTIWEIITTSTWQQQANLFGFVENAAKDVKTSPMNDEIWQLVSRFSRRKVGPNLCLSLIHI